MRLELTRRLDLQERLFGGIEKESLTFLTSSTGLIQLIDRASSDSCTIDDVARLVHSEPLVSAKMVAMANSAAYGRPGRAVTNAREALSILGLKMLRAVAAALVTAQLADRAAQVNQPAVGRLWAHSTEVAALAAVLARRFTDVAPETALFAGMLHDIAGFYVLAKAQEQVPALSIDLAGRAQVGDPEPPERSQSVLAVGTRRLLSALNVPDELSEAMETLWRGYVIAPPETLGDVLQLANLMAQTQSPFEEFSREPAQCGIDLDEVLERGEAAQVVRQAYDEVRAVQQALTRRG